MKTMVRREKRQWNLPSPDPTKRARQTARKQAACKPPASRTRPQLNDDHSRRQVEPPKNGKTTHAYHTAGPAKPGKNNSKTTNQRSRPPKSKASSSSDGVERRARRYRDHAPQSFLERMRRISIQRYVLKYIPATISQHSFTNIKYLRMFVVGHTVTEMNENLEISFGIVGSTGNIYKTVIRKEPTCDCPDGKSGNQCKHICYGKPAMSR